MKPNINEIKVRAQTVNNFKNPPKTLILFNALKVLDGEEEMLQLLQLKHVTEKLLTS